MSDETKELGEQPHSLDGLVGHLCGMETFLADDVSDSAPMAGSTISQPHRWTVASDGPMGPLKTIYKSSLYKSERRIRERFAFDYPNQVIEGISSNDTDESFERS